MSLYHTLCVLLIFFSLCPGYTISQIITQHPDLDGLLPNGNFEQTPLKSKMKGRRIIGANSLPHWQILGNVELVSGGLQPGGLNYSIPRGAHAVKLGSFAIISQEVKVKRGLVYSLTIGATRSCAVDKNLKVSVPGRSGMIPIQTIFSSDGGDSYAWAFRATSDVVRVTLQNLDLHQDRTCGPLVNLVAIKEILPPSQNVRISVPNPFLTIPFNFVKNGGFEIGPYVYAKYSTGVLIPAKSEDSISPLREWFVESPKPVKYITNSNFELPIVLPAVELIAGSESAISQVIRTEAGKVHFLSFRVGDAHNDCHGSMMVKAFVGKESFNVSFVSQGKGYFQREIFRFVPVSESTKLTFYSVFNHTKLHHHSGDVCGPVLDSIAVTRTLLFS